MFTSHSSPEKCLHYAEQLQKLGINFIRVAIFVVFAWIGGLKAFQYEADGIVPFVANSPMMSFFYNNLSFHHFFYKIINLFLKSIFQILKTLIGFNTSKIQTYWFIS